jgi:argininosuccinate synthase
MNRGIKKVVLAYSGGLDTSVILKRMRRRWSRFAPILARGKICRP